MTELERIILYGLAFNYMLELVLKTLVLIFKKD